jgi:rod shape-determining protein MreC
MHGRVSRLAVPARAAVQRSAYLLLISAALALLVLGRSDNEALSRFRAAVTDLLAPALAVLAAPVDSVRGLVATGREAWYAHRDNERLREDVERLMYWREIARKLEQQNAVLRAQLNLQPVPLAHFITAPVIADTGGAFVRTLVVGAGARDGAAPGQAAMTGTGLVGRVTQVGERASRLLLLSDLNSRVPVLVEGSRHRGVLAGDNSERPRLIYLPGAAQIRPGDRIVTSGHGGLFPKYLPVGVVASVEEGEIRVQPFVDWDRLEYVTLLRYEAARPETPRTGTPY